MMFRCSLALALLGATTHAFQAPGRLSATWSASSHLSTSQARLARTTTNKFATELKSTKMNYANYAQPMNQRELRLMNQRGPSQVFGGTFSAQAGSSGLVGYNNYQNGNYPQVYNNGYDGVMTRRERLAATHIPTGAAFMNGGFGPYAGSYGQVGLGGGYARYRSRFGYGGFGMGYHGYGGMMGGMYGGGRYSMGGMGYGRGSSFYQGGYSPYGSVGGSNAYIGHGSIGRMGGFSGGYYGGGFGGGYYGGGVGGGYYGGGYGGMY